MRALETHFHRAAARTRQCAGQHRSLSKSPLGSAHRSNQVCPMSQLVLVIHGAGEPRRRGRKVYWEPLLGDALGPAYRVRAPRMPDPENPDDGAWRERIAQLVLEAHRPVLVGHSFGASTLLRFVAQAEPQLAFRGLFLVATPFWEKEDFPDSLSL